MKFVAFVSLTLSAACFALSTYGGSPAKAALPGPGLETADLFSVTTSARYRLEALVPSKGPRPLALPALAAIPCKLLVTLEGPEGFKSEQTITALAHAGDFAWGKTDIYVATTEPIELKSGSYTFRLANLGAPGELQERGAMVTFGTFERPTEAYLQGTLVRGAGWLFLAVGVASALWSSMRRQ